MPTSDVSMKQGTHTMLKKMLLYIPIIFLSALFMQNSLPSRGLLGLIEGVNIRNSNMLVASDFLFISLVVFNLFGNCEKYLYGYGKYELLRYKIILVSMCILPDPDNYLCFFIIYPQRKNY